MGQDTDSSPAISISDQDNYHHVQTDKESMEQQ